MSLRMRKLLALAGAALALVIGQISVTGCEGRPGDPAAPDTTVGGKFTFGIE
jgi:hypothetical protein